MDREMGSVAGAVVFISYTAIGKEEVDHRRFFVAVVFKSSMINLTLIVALKWCLHIISDV